MAIQPGARVTVLARSSDPVILTLQRHATVSRVTEEGVFVTLEATFPPNQEFGPFASSQLLPGWQNP